jgi:hypothetical protein
MQEEGMKILGLMVELRRRVGTVKARKKEGVQFRVRALDELVDKVRPVANELGIVIYPTTVAASTQVTDAGVLTELTITVRLQAVEDGSYVDVQGYGLGADKQDKAGGKAGSYAFKQALVQALLAGGAEDTDDTDTPVQGGVRKLRPALLLVKSELAGAATEPAYRKAVELLKCCSPEDQLALRETAMEARTRCGIK